MGLGATRLKKCRGDGIRPRVKAAIERSQVDLIDKAQELYIVHPPPDTYRGGDGSKKSSMGYKHLTRTHLVTPGDSLEKGGCINGSAVRTIHFADKRVIGMGDLSTPNEEALP